MRFNELLTGIREDVAVKLYGDDLEILADKAEEISGLIPGMYISGHLHTDENYTRTLPNDAIVTEGTKSFIFIFDETEFSYDMTFRMVEVITGQKDNSYTEIFLIDSLKENTKIVMNAAYYLLADMKKEETEHEH